MGASVGIHEQVAKVDTVTVLQAELGGEGEGLGLGPNGRYFGQGAADVDEGHGQKVY